MILLVLAAAIMLAVFVRPLIRNDNLTALENLDDEALAAQAAQAWEAGKW